MTKWFVLLTAALLFVGIQSLRADDVKSPGKVCSQGRVVFGRLSCASAEEPASMFDAYFYGATSIKEIIKSEPARFEKIRSKCERKLHNRNISSHDARRSAQSLNLRVEAVDTCLGKRGYDQPCAKNADCIENYCHPDRGTCSAVFTVPLNAPQ